MRLHACRSSTGCVEQSEGFVTSKRLTPEEVHAVGVAAVENGLELMTDAAVLLGAGRPLRAYALGVIAVEGRETSGLPRRAGPMGKRNDYGRRAERSVETRRRSACQTVRNDARLLTALTSSVPLPQGFDDLEALAIADMQSRERVLYVEVAPGGEPMAPTGISEDSARTWVTAMINYFAMLGSAWRPGLDDDLAIARGGPNPFESP